MCKNENTAMSSSRKEKPKAFHLRSKSSEVPHNDAQSGKGHVVVCGARHMMLFACVLLVNVSTVFPSITGGDAGELLAEACHFGIAHPPGYPLLTFIHYTMSRLVQSSALPVYAEHPPMECMDSSPGEVALAANLLAAVLGAATAVLLAVAVEQWTVGSRAVYNRGAAAAGALLFCFSPLAWEQHTGTEVFALNNFLVALVVVIAARATRHPSYKDARIVAVVCGLAFANQHSALLALAPLALIAILPAFHRAQLLSWRSLAAWGLVWLSFGLSPYVYLIIASQTPKQGSWGDLSTMRGFTRHVLRQEYGTLRLGVATPNATGAFERIIEYLSDSAQQTMIVGPLLAILGVSWTISAPHLDGLRRAFPHGKSISAFGTGLAAAWAFNVAIWHGVFSNISLKHPMSRAVHARFWIQPNLLLCVGAGAGIGLLVNGASAFCLKRWPSLLQPNRRIFGIILSVLTPVLVGTAAVWSRWETMNRGTWNAEDPSGWTIHLHAQAMLSSLPHRALLLSHTDLDLNAARYLRVCEGFRTDVTHISLQMMPYPWWGTVQAKHYDGAIFPPIVRGVSTNRESEGNAILITRFLAANMPLGRPMFIDMQAVDEREIGTVGAYRGFSLVPHGLTYRVLPGMSPYESERWHEEVVLQLQRLESCMRPAPTKKYPAGTWEFAASSVFWDAHYQAGLFFLSYAVAVWERKHGGDQRKHALPALRKASTLLLHTLEAADNHGTFSSSRADLLKNTALAEMRLYHGLHESLAAAKKSNPSTFREENNAFPPVIDKLARELVWAKGQCLKLIPRFLLEAENDKDAEVFGKEYMLLRGGV